MAGVTWQAALIASQQMQQQLEMALYQQQLAMQHQVRVLLRADILADRSLATLVRIVSGHVHMSCCIYVVLSDT